MYSIYVYVYVVVLLPYMCICMIFVYVCKTHRDLIRFEAEFVQFIHAFICPISIVRASFFHMYSCHFSASMFLILRRRLQVWHGDASDLSQTPTPCNPTPDRQHLVHVSWSPLWALQLNPLCGQFSCGSCIRVRNVTLLVCSK
jgi:hypothetical protein